MLWIGYTYLVYVFASCAISVVVSIQLFHAFSFVILAPHLTYILKHFVLSCLVLCITGFCFGYITIPAIIPATRLPSTAILTQSLNQSITLSPSFLPSLPFLNNPFPHFPTNVFPSIWSPNSAITINTLLAIHFRSCFHSCSYNHPTRSQRHTVYFLFLHFLHWLPLASFCDMYPVLSSSVDFVSLLILHWCLWRLSFTVITHRLSLFPAIPFLFHCFHPLIPLQMYQAIYFCNLI